MNEYYSVIFIINKIHYFCIWVTDDKTDSDGFLKNNDNIVFFKDFESIKEYGRNNDINIIDEESIYNVDYFNNWLSTKDENIDCNIFLNFWNIADDLAFSINSKFIGNEEEMYIDVYNKLFYGCNLPAMRGDGEIFTPLWDEEDIETLYNVICDGIRLVKLAFQTS